MFSHFLLLRSLVHRLLSRRALLVLVLGGMACGARSGTDTKNIPTVDAGSHDMRARDLQRDRFDPSPDACVPACGERRCGPDPVCGQVCGICPKEEVCSTSGTCHAPATWQDVPHPPINTIEDVWASGPNDVWMVGDAPVASGGLRGIVLHYDGKKISERLIPPSPTLNGVGGSSSNDVWVVGDKGTILHYMTGTWKKRPSPTTEILFDVWVDSPKAAWAAGREGAFRYDSVKGWTKATPVGWNLTKVCGRASDDIWATGPGIEVHFDGKTWEKQYLSKTWPYDVALWCQPGSDVWIAMTEKVYRYHGHRWTSAKLPPQKDIYMWDLHGTSSTDLWAAASDTLHYDGKTWTVSSLKGPFAIFAVAPDDVWAAGIKYIAHYH